MEKKFTLDEAEVLLKKWEDYSGKLVCGYTKKTWTSKQMREMSKDVAYELLKIGLQEGDNVPILLSNTITFPVILMALLYIKCNPLLVNVSSNFDELLKLHEIIGFEYFIHDYINITSRINVEPTEHVWKKTIGGVSVFLMSVLKLYNQGNRTPLKESLCVEKKYKGVILHLTSGTSGRARVCVRNQKVAVAEAQNFLSEIDLFNAKSNILITTPLSHAFAYGFGLITSIISNSTLWIDINFNPRKIIRLLANEPIDILGIVPSMIKLIFKASDMLHMNKMAKAVFFAGADCSDSLKEQFKIKYGTKLYAIYGSTETGTIATTYSSYNPNLKGVGNVYKNVTVSIHRTDKYNELWPESGEIVVKSNSMMQGYYGVLGMSEDITHSTGDIGYFDGESLILCGRIKDIINVNGIKVMPDEIENIIKQYPGIEEVVVYPGLSKSGEEKICCAFSSKEKICEESLRSYCVEKLSIYKIPRNFYKLDNLPKTSSGKYKKYLLPNYWKENIAEE